jgi:hypothetical protein
MRLGTWEKNGEFKYGLNSSSFVRLFTAQIINGSACEIAPQKVQCTITEKEKVTMNRSQLKVAHLEVKKRLK